jgi:predicted PurR-regulated permease PerM
MHVNPPDLVLAFSLALSAFAISLVVIGMICSRLKQLIRKPKASRKRRRFGISAVGAAMVLAFLPLASIYRPSLIEVTKAQIRQQENADEDDNGDPESSLKHLLRQLRRIRRGEKVETLFLRQKMKKDIVTAQPEVHRFL